MLKLVLRGIAANKGRLFLTLVSITLGVGAVSGSFVLADSLRAVFSDISVQAFAGVDAQVRAIEPELQSSQDLPRFDDSVVDAVASVPGVEVAEGGVFAFEQVYTTDSDGEVVRPLGPPVFASSWGGPTAVSSFTLVDGEAPVGQQIAIDEGQATNAKFNVGDTITVTVPSGVPEDFTVSGIIRFGSEPGGSGGAYFNLFDLPTAQRILDLEGQIDSIIVAADNSMTSDELLTAIGDVLPEGVEVVSSETVIGEQQDQFGQIVDIIGNILLGFAIVILFVSTFIIYNTFAILVSQRTQQIGLLRAIGASASQVRRMVLLESVVVGFIASVAGLFTGLGIAALLKWVFSLGGNQFPDGPLELRVRTIIVVFIVGMFVTVVSALIPAFKASRITPLEALQNTAQQQRSLRVRIITGLVVLVPGIALLAFGLFGGSDSTGGVLTALGLGSALTFIGVAMLSALFASPVASALGAPVEAVKGVTGRLARDNAARNPQRTAATATALMIGLALITGVSVLVQSLRDTFTDIIDNSLSADLFIFEEAQGLPFSAVLVDQLGAVADVDLVAGFAVIEAKVDGEVESVGGFDTATGTGVVDVDILEGTPELTSNEIAMDDDKATDAGYAIGDSVTIEFEDGAVDTFTVATIYADATLAGSMYIDRTVTSQHVATDSVGFVGLTYVDGADPAKTRAAVEEVTAAFSQVSVQDNAEFKASQKAQIDQLQFLLFGLLGLCLVVAFFGIINTMALSVLERTREIGLLRAVGTTRSQLRSSIRWEAVIVSVFGALLGVLMGLLLGWAAVSAVGDFIPNLGIPWSLMIIFLIIGAVIGVLAAYFPARRAAKLNVLDAIAATS